MNERTYKHFFKELTNADRCYVELNNRYHPIFPSPSPFHFPFLSADQSNRVNKMIRPYIKRKDNKYSLRSNIYDNSG